MTYGEVVGKDEENVDNARGRDRALRLQRCLSDVIMEQKGWILRTASASRSA